MKWSTDSNQPFRGQGSSAASFLLLSFSIVDPNQASPGCKVCDCGVFRWFSRKGSWIPMASAHPGSLSLKEACGNHTVKKPTKTMQQSIYRVCVPNHKTTKCSLLRIHRQLLDCQSLDCKFINYISVMADSAV